MTLITQTNRTIPLYSSWVSITNQPVERGLRQKVPQQLTDPTAQSEIHLAYLTPCSVRHLITL